MADLQPSAGDLLAFIDASPSPFHCAAEAARRLDRAGFHHLDERSPWPVTAGACYVLRGGSLVAWRTTGGADPLAGFRIIGAHTDSPNLRLKPNPDTGRVGYRQLAVEVYGGVLRNSWLDRDLGLSGRVAIAGDSIEARLVRIDRPWARIPQLAIHLDRTANEGLALNPQMHLVPVWGVGDATDGDLVRAVAAELDVDPQQILGHDLMFHDLCPAGLLGQGGEFVSAPRIDNQLSCWAAIEALVGVGGQGPARGAAPVPLVCLFDHEEVGSQTSTGADSTLLPTVLERISLMAGLDREGFHRALAGSRCLSADGAHATHPNYADRHEPGHLVRIDGGPVLKVNANQRYSTDASGAAALRRCARRAGVPLQSFVVRSDLACGSTIGPVTASRLGIETVDVGVAQLSMHSVRELCGRLDAERFPNLLAAFLDETVE